MLPMFLRAMVNGFTLAGGFRDCVRHGDTCYNHGNWGDIAMDGGMLLPRNASNASAEFGMVTTLSFNQTYTHVYNITAVLPASNSSGGGATVIFPCSGALSSQGGTEPGDCTADLSSLGGFGVDGNGSGVCAGQDKRDSS